MCLFTHVAAGAVAGALAPAPYLAPLFALGSHIVLDIMPHYDIDRMRYEVFLAAVAVAVIAVGHALSLKVFLGVAFGVLPDFENLLWKLGVIRDDQKIFPGHRKFIPHGMVLGATNLVFQAAVSAAAITYVIRRGA